MENNVFNFPNPSSLIIFEGYFVPTQDVLLVNTYTTCASKLQILSLGATDSNFNVLVSQNASDLTSSEEVTFSFYPHCTVDNGVSSIFFQAISSTLTTLDISFGEKKPEATQPKLTSFLLTQLAWVNTQVSSNTSICNTKVITH